MASQVDEETGEVIAGASTFSATTSEVYSWLELGTIDAAHQVEWRWISPDGSLYYSYVDWISKPESGPVDSYNTYSYIAISGEDAASMPGKWHVDIFLDGDAQKSLTEQFTILGQGVEQFSEASTGSMKTGCHTDPASGKIICVDATSDFSNPTQNVQGGCYQDPATGKIICVDTSGDFSNPTPNAQGGCYRDPATKQMICIDTVGDLSGEGEIGEQI